jgi:nicotinate phosphoribosyltransferase
MVTKAMMNENEATKHINGANGKCVGTSNIYFAMKYNIKLIGTMAHEFVSAIAGMYGPTEANFIAMDMWQKTFQGALGIYLYDTYTWKPFADNFSEHFARCFAGLRIDSGNNEEQLNKIINKYKELGVDHKSKQVVFSNAFTVDSAIELNNKIKDKCIASFGIGTSLTGDVTNCSPSNIVIKLVASKITEKREWNETCKMSEDKGKVTGNKDIVELFSKLLHLS